MEKPENELGRIGQLCASIVANLAILFILALCMIGIQLTVLNITSPRGSHTGDIAPYSYSIEEYNQFPTVDLSNETWVEHVKMNTKVSKLDPDKKYELVSYVALDLSDTNGIATPRHKERMYRIDGFEPTVTEITNMTEGSVYYELALPKVKEGKLIVFDFLKTVE